MCEVAQVVLQLGFKLVSYRIQDRYAEVHATLC